MLRVNLCTAAAPLSAGWMHQSRYCCPDLFCCSSAAVAYSIALYVGQWPDVDFADMWPRGTRESNGRGPAATTAMWPAVLTGGRPSPEATGQLPAGSPLALCRSVSGGISLAKAAGHRQVADKQQAAGGCVAATGSCPTGAGVNCKGRDRVRSTWRGSCRALVEEDLFSC
jgi:hypothetical protein